MAYDNGSSPTRHYHVQGLNWNVVATTDSTGTAEELVTYDPYGRPSIWTGGGGTTSYEVSNADADFLFQGRWLERYVSDTKKVRLYHFRKRAYGPKLGRFLQRDPLGYGDGLNLYEFEKSTPILLSDPTGGVYSRKREEGKAGSLTVRIAIKIDPPDPPPNCPCPPGTGSQRFYVRMNAKWNRKGQCTTPGWGPGSYGPTPPPGFGRPPAGQGF